MKGPELGPRGEDITWPDQMTPRGRRTPSSRRVKPQTSNLSGSGSHAPTGRGPCGRGGLVPGGVWGGEEGRAAGGFVGRSCARLPLAGRAVPSGRSRWAGWHRAWGVGSCATQSAGRWLICPCASPARVKRRASTALHWPWRVQPPYCSRSCPCAAALPPSNGVMVGRNVAFAAERRGLPACGPSGPRGRGAVGPGGQGGRGLGSPLRRRELRLVGRASAVRGVLGVPSALGGGGARRLPCPCNPPLARLPLCGREDVVRA